MSPIRIRNIRTDIILKYLFGCITLLLLASYIIFQARLFIAGPQVTLLDEPSSIQTSQTVTLSGLATNITEITLNGKYISTDEDGFFQEQVILENGYTIASLKARNRYGRETELIREFVYTPLSLYKN